MQKKSSLVGKIIMLIIVVILTIILVKVYKKNNYNDYIRAEYNIGLSTFIRDEDVRYSKDTYSYKIENTEYNDAMFYKKVKVTPNTSYKVTCMVKTQGVQTKNPKTDAGAHISIADTIEKSVNVVGTTDWTKLEFIFNSKNREEVDIGFRLGGYQDNCIGTAWFSHMTIESGLSVQDNEWDFLCLIYDNVDVNVKVGSETQNIKLGLNRDDVYDITTSFRRFGSSIESLSKNKIRANTTVIEVDEPIRTMTYDEVNGYYVSSNDIKEVVDKYVEEDKYDHIFVAFKTGDINQKKEIPINDWIGLGGMEYRNIGYSNIRIPSESNSYIYKYDSRINTFPEEVFVHEFLHTLERNCEEYGYERPELHDNEKYGYKSERLISLKQWYADYLNCEIKTTSGYIGLNSNIFDKTPVKQSHFEYSHKLKDFNEPENIIEELHNFLDKIINLFAPQEEIEEVNNQV